MFNYCQKCRFDTKDTVSISQHLGLKINQRTCTVECEICGVVKFTGRLTQHEYVDYTKENVDE